MFQNLPDFQIHDNLFFGLDLAKKTSQLAILIPTGQELANFPFPSTKNNFTALAKLLRPNDSIALEVSTPASAVMSIFKLHSTANTVLSNPLFTKSIPKAEIYQRSCDEALRIADLLCLGKKLTEISPTGFNPRKPNHTDWQKVLKIVAESYAQESAKNKAEKKRGKSGSKRKNELKKTENREQNSVLMEKIERKKSLRGEATENPWS
jgi:hypothetical protein